MRSRIATWLYRNAPWSTEPSLARRMWRLAYRIDRPSGPPGETLSVRL